MKQILNKFNWLIALMLTILTVSRILFYTLVDVSIISKGFFFDVIIDVGLVFFIVLHF